MRPRTSRLAVHALAAVAALGSSRCAADLPDDDAPLATARRLASADGRLASSLSLADGGLARRGRSPADLDGAAFFSLSHDAPPSPRGAPAPLTAALPERAGGVARLAVGRRRDRSLSLALVGARDVEGRDDAGHVVYRDTHTSTDTIWSAHEQSVEILHLLRDPSAPTSFSYRLASPPRERLASPEREPSGALLFRDQHRAPVLRVLPPFAVDAAGTRRDASLSFDRDTITVSLDARGLSFPVLLDPLVETASWTKLHDGVAPVAPDARILHTLTYDSVRKVSVLVGGEAGSTFFGDTWEYDGSTWTKRSLSTNPTPRSSHVTILDPMGKLVLHGGITSGNSWPQLPFWIYDGNNWMSAPDPPDVPNPPPDAPAQGLRRHAASWDGARATMVFAYGYSEQLAGAASNDTIYELKQQTWSKKTAKLNGATTFRAGAAGVYFPSLNKTILLGGSDGANATSTTLAWDGTSLTALAPMPLAAEAHVAATDAARGVIYLYGGIGDADLSKHQHVFEFDGTSWKDLGIGPPRRTNAAAAFDDARKRLVLFGGADTSGTPLDETWEFDPETKVWEQVGAVPGLRSDASLVYDDAHDELVLFRGGAAPDGSDLAAGTWVFKQGRWVRRLARTTELPAATAGGAAYLAKTSKIVAFGGRDQGGPIASAHEWDGTDWKPIGASGPSARDGLELIADTGKQRVLVPWGGGPSAADDLWAYDGTTFAKLTQSGATPRFEYVAGFDTTLGKPVLHGGSGSPGAASSETIAYDEASGAWQVVATDGPERRLAAGAYDVDRRRLVLFGGTPGGAISAQSDTHEFNGSTWKPMNVSGPPARVAAAAAYSPDERAVLLYGGAGPGQVYGDLWRYAVQTSGCDVDADCSGGGHCVDGVCCNSACDGDCEACVDALTGAGDGTCAPLKCQTGEVCSNDTCTSGSGGAAGAAGAGGTAGAAGAAAGGGQSAAGAGGTAGEGGMGGSAGEGGAGEAGGPQAGAAGKGGGAEGGSAGATGGAGQGGLGGSGKGGSGGGAGGAAGGSTGNVSAGNTSAGGDSQGGASGGTSGAFARPAALDVVGADVPDGGTCGCVVVGDQRRSGGAALALVAAALLASRRRRAALTCGRRSLRSSACRPAPGWSVARGASQAPPPALACPSARPWGQPAGPLALSPAPSPARSRRPAPGASVASLAPRQAVQPDAQ